MILTVRSLLIALLVLVPVLSRADVRAFDPLAAYGDRIIFEVQRNGTPVGRHTVDFYPIDEGVLVDVELRLAVTFLGLTVYQFGYRSEAIWQQGRLDELTAFTDDDGDTRKVSARMAADGLVTISGPDGDQASPGPLWPTNHWNPLVTGQDQVINTITGKVADVTITRVGSDRIDVGGRTVLATRYVYSGDLHDVEVWYDRDGRWVRLRFPDKQDGVIDYRCIRCGPAEDEN